MNGIRRTTVIVPILAIFIYVIGADQVPKVTMTGNTDGRDWLNWPAESREFYVAGYLHGYSEGFTEACHAAEGVSTVVQVSNCLHSRLTYSRLPQTLSRQITEFYRAYPQDKNINVLLLVRQFSEQNNRSAEVIHERLQSGKPL
jgi:hypothetical protein